MGQLCYLPVASRGLLRNQFLFKFVPFFAHLFHDHQVNFHLSLVFRTQL